MLAEISNNVKAIRCDFFVCKVNKQAYNCVNDFETFNQMVFILLDEAQISDYQNNCFQMVD